MKRKRVNYAAGIALCLSMALAPAVLYHTVKAGIGELEGQVFTAETPAQYAEEFSGGQNEPELVTNELFIPDSQLEAFKEIVLKELSDQGMELPDSLGFFAYFDGSFFAPADDAGGMSLGLMWTKTEGPKEYVSAGFIGADIDAGTGKLYFIQASGCYDASLLDGFIDAGERRFREKLSPIPENYETSAFIVWQYLGEDTRPEIRVTIYWNDPLEKEVMTNLTLTELSTGLLEYSITFDKADLDKQDGEVIGMFRRGVFASQQDNFRPIEDFTVDEMEVMEKAARDFAEDMGMYAGGVLSSKGFNFGAGAIGVRFEFDSEGRNGYDQPVIITVTRTGTVVGYAISL